MSATSNGSFLAVRALVKRFGAVSAVAGITINLGEPGIAGLIGPNGSGKTTLLNLISGVHRPSGGSIYWGNRDITGWTPYHIARLGIARTFQHSMTFGGLTVAANLIVALDARHRDHTVIDSLLDVHGLAAFRDVRAKDLPFGVSRRLGIATAMATGPRLLLLDEPAVGLNDVETAELATTLCHIRDEGTAIVMIDHHMGFLMPLCHRVVVLDAGAVIADDAPAAIRRDATVVSIYLGSGYAKD